MLFQNLIQSSLPQKSQHNDNSYTPETLFIGRVKIITKDTTKNTLYDVDRIVKIDMGSSSVYSIPNHIAGNHSFKRQRNDTVIIHQLQDPQSIYLQTIAQLPLAEKHIAIKISEKDPYLSMYLAKLNIKDTSGFLVILLDTKNKTIMPLIFKQKQRAHDFAIAYSINRIYKQYYEKTNSFINLTLLESITQSALKSEYQIDPDKLSHEDQQKQLKMIREYFSQNIRIRQTGIQICCKFKMIQNEAIDYFRNIFIDQQLGEYLVRLKAQGCYLSQNLVLSYFLRLSQKQDLRFTDHKMPYNGNNYPFRNIKTLSLRNNSLNDDCFRVLIKLSKNAKFLKSIDLSHNSIQLNCQQNTVQVIANRISSRISSRISINQSTVKNYIEAPFIQFLLNISVPLESLYLDNNQIKNCKILNQYLIEAINIPLRFLSLRQNNFSQLQKIKMIKCWLQDRKDRQRQATDLSINDTQFFIDNSRITNNQMIFEDFVINFGRVSIIDRDTQWYHLNMVRICKKYGIIMNIGQNTNKQPLSLEKVVPIKISDNPQWRVCDPQQIKTTDNQLLPRNNSFLERSRKASQANLNSNKNQLVQPQALTQQTFKPAVAKLQKAYSTFNYHELRIYKQLLQEYNQQLYKIRIMPKFVKHQKHIKLDKNQIKTQVQKIYNFEENQKQINKKLDMFIGQMFRRRINHEVYGFNNQSKNQQQDIILDAEGNQISQVFSSNAFPPLIYLKQLRDQFIQQYLQSPLDLQKRTLEKSICIRTLKQLYQQQFKLSRQDSLVHEDYQSLIQLSQLQLQKKLAKMYVSLNMNDDYAVCCIHRYHYLNKQRLLWEQQYRALIQVKLQPVKMLRKYKQIKQLLLQNKVPINKPFQLDRQISLQSNKMQFIVQYDILTNPPFRMKKIDIDQKPKYPVQMLPQSFGVERLKQYSERVVILLQYLCYYPSRIAQQTVQYIQFIVNTILQASQQDSIILSNQFYLQLLCYPFQKLANGMLSTLIQYFSFYTKQNQQLEPYITAFLLKNQPNRNPDFIKVRDKQGQLNRKIQKQINKMPKKLEQKIFKQLSFIVKIRVWVIGQADQYTQTTKRFYQKPLILSFHLLADLAEIYQTAFNAYNSAMQANLDSSHYWLFLYNPTNEQTKLLTPSIANNLFQLLQKNILYLFQQNMVTQDGTIKSMLIIKRIVYPFELYNPRIYGGYNQNHWKYYYQQIKYNYYHYGNLLTMIDQKQQILAQAIAYCIICQFLQNTALKQNLTKLISMQEHELSQFLLTILQKNYFENIQQYVPLGTKSILNSIHYQIIKKQFVKFSMNYLMNTEHDSNKQYQLSVYKFSKFCGFFGECVQLSDGISQQLVIGNNGIVHVQRLFTVTHIYWRQIIDIQLHKRQFNIQLVISYRKINKQKKIIQPKNSLLINDYAGSALFLRNILVLIQYYSKLIIKSETEQIYKFMDEIASPKQIDIIQHQKRYSEVLQNILQGKSDQIIADQPIFIQKIQPFIIFTQQYNTQLDEFDFKQSPIQNQQQQQKYQNYQVSVQQSSNRDSINRRQQESQISRQRRKSSKNVKIQIQKQSQISLQKRKSQSRISQKFDNPNNINLDTIITQAHKDDNQHQNIEQNAQNRQNAQNNQQQMIITNMRRSSKRQLPKRRSSRKR